jgi:hypothetical protein
VPLAPIEGAMTFIGKHWLFIPHFDEAKFDQRHEIALADGCKFCSLGFDIA